MSSYCIIETTKLISETKASKKEITNELHAQDIVRMAQLHIKYICFRLFRDALPRIEDANLRGHFTNLCSLMGLHFIKDYVAVGYESRYLKKGAFHLMNEAIKILLARIRPQLIPIVEGFGFRDSVLTSAIGNSYGDIYETHLEWAKTSRLNNDKGSIPDGFMEYIMPILKGKL